MSFLNKAHAYIVGVARPQQATPHQPGQGTTRHRHSIVFTDRLLHVCLGLEFHIFLPALRWTVLPGVWPKTDAWTMGHILLAWYRMFLYNTKGINDDRPRAPSANHYTNKKHFLASARASPRPRAFRLSNYHKSSNLSPLSQFDFHRLKITRSSCFS